MSLGPERRRVFAAACLGMLVFGIAITVLGSTLPSLLARFALDKTEGGALLSLSSAGILVGSVVFGPLVDRYGYRGPLVLATALVAAGLEGIALSPSLGPLRVAVLAVGLGGGVLNGATNAAVADVSEDGRSAGLSVLGAFFGLGALGVPLLLGLLLGRVGYDALLVAVGVAAALPLVVLARVPFPAPKQAHGFPVNEALSLLGRPTLLLLGAMLFFQSGMEITVGGWTATYFHQELGLAAERATLPLSLFWLAITAARLGLGVVLARAAAAKVLVASLGVALAGSFVLLTSRGVASAAVGVVLVGLGFAATFPVVLGWVASLWPALSGTAIGIVLVMALAGGTLLPYVTGRLADAHGLRAALAVVPACLCGLAVVLGLVGRRLAPRAG